MALSEEEKKSRKNERNRRWRATPQGSEYYRKRYAIPEVRARKLESNRKYRSKPGIKAKIRESTRKITYNLQPGEWDAIFIAQGSKCAICQDDKPAVTKRPWHTDHCHLTGKVRGILCHHCNTAIGALKDNPSLMRIAADYVEKHSEW